MDCLCLSLEPQLLGGDGGLRVKERVSLIRRRAGTRCAPISSQATNELGTGDPENLAEIEKAMICGESFKPEGCP